MQPTALLLVSALGAGFGPFATARAPVTADARRAAAPAKADAQAAIEFPWSAYRASVGSFQGPRCPHVPSCSAYALQAVRRHGWAAGGVLTTHRLFRGTRSSSVRPLARERNGRWIDRLEDATFWLGRDRR